MKRETRVLTNALLSFVSRGVMIAVGLFMVPFLLGSLGEATYGVIGIINSVLASTVLVELGIRPATARQFARFLFSGDTRRANEIASTAMAFYACMGVAVVVGMWFLASSLVDLFQVDTSLREDSTTALMIVSISLGFTLVATPYRAALVSQLRHDIEHYSQIFGTLFRASFIVALFLLWQPRLIIWAFGALLSSVSILTLVRWRSRVHCPSLHLDWRHVSRRAAGDLSGLATDTTITQLSNWMNQQSGPLIISYFLGTVQVAHYTPALVLAIALQGLSVTFLGQLQPIVTRAFVDSDLEVVRRVLLRSTRYTLLLNGGASLWCACLSPLIAVCWLGEGFQDTAVVLLLWSGTVFLRSCVGGAFPIALGAGRLRAVSMANAALAVVNVIIAIVLVGFAGYGVIGAAIGVCGTQVAQTVIWVVMAVRISRIGIRQYLRDSYLGPVLCNVCLIGTALCVQFLMEAEPAMELAWAGGLALLVFCTLAWTVGLNHEDREKAVGYLRAAWSRIFWWLGRG